MLAHLSSYLRLPSQPVNDKSPVLLVNAGTRHWALLVDSVSSQQEIVAKHLGPHLRQVPGVPGATVLGNGQVVLILDPPELLVRAPAKDAVIPEIPSPGAMQSGQRVPAMALGPQAALRGAPAAAPTLSGARSPLVTGNGPPRQIPYLLVVDDSPSVRRVVSATLRAAGWDVKTAHDGVEALEIVAQRVPAGVLLDIEMPRMDGYQLMEELRRHPATANVPLIVLTSRAATKHQQRALQLGANAYVTKPYQDDVLIQTIEEHVPVRPTGEPRA